MKTNSYQPNCWWSCIKNKMSWITVIQIVLAVEHKSSDIVLFDIFQSNHMWVQICDRGRGEEEGVEGTLIYLTIYLAVKVQGMQTSKTHIIIVEILMFQGKISRNYNIGWEGT